nr:uncharacterized protein LOC124815447 isoform X1 [Hydra vulgaris]
MSLDTYEKACLKLKTAEDTSDLLTEPEQQQPVRLRTKRKIIDYNIDTTQIMSDNDIEFSVAKNIKKSLYPKKDLQNAPFVPPLSLQQSVSLMSEEVLFSNKTPSNEAQCILSQDVSEKLVTVLMEIKSELKDLKRQTEFNTKMLQQMLECKEDDGILEKYSFPLDNLEELCEIEKLLAADKAAFNKLIIAVASKGGQTLKEAVRRMTFALFTNNLCCKLNWTGITRKDNESIFVKQSLKDLQCRHVLESNFFF